MPHRPRWSDATVVDSALAAVVCAVGLLEIVVPFSSRAGNGSAVMSGVTVVLLTIPLTFRRTHGLVVQLIGVVGIIGLNAVADIYVLFFGGLVPLGIALYSTARHGRGRTPFLGAGLGAVTLVLADLTVSELQEPGEIVFHWGVFVLVWITGYTVSVLERRSREATAHAIAVEVTAAEQTITAVLEERTRIARELHDIVAHSMSMMVVQAGAAELVVEDDPAFTRRALGTIRTTGNGALAEMRRLVTMLRDADDESATSPQPGLDGVPALIADARSAGLEATLEIDGPARELPVGLDLAAFRIVQEALTNVRRHADAHRVDVRLRYAPTELSIVVADDGRGSGPVMPGHGLIGMRERAALYGGRIETENGVGFTVRAVLPLASS